MKRILVAVVIFFFATVPLLAGDGDTILGVWATDPEGEGGQAHIEIIVVDGKYSGKIVWLEEPLYTADDEDGEVGEPKIDKNNPDPALQTRPIMAAIPSSLRTESASSVCSLTSDLQISQ